MLVFLSSVINALKGRPGREILGYHLSVLHVRCLAIAR